MSAAKLRTVAEPVAPVVAISPLDAARARVADLKAKVAAVIAKKDRAENSTSAVEAKAAAAQGWRQRLMAIFVGKVEAGALDTSTPEETDLRRKLGEVGNADLESAVMMAAARRSVVRDCESEETDLRNQLAVAQRELDVAIVEALNTEIEELKSDYRAAAEAFYRGPHARLIAAGLLSCELCRDLNTKYGLSVQPIGAPRADPTIKLAPIGFGFQDGGGYNTLKVHIGATLGAAYSELKGKWSS